MGEQLNSGTGGGGGGGGGNGSGSSLTALLPYVTTLVTIASNPQKWAKNNLIDWLKEVVVVIVAEWIVGTILSGAQYVLGWLIFAYARTKSILLTAIPPLTTPFTIVENTVVGVVQTVYGAAQSVGELAGLAGPPAAAVTILILSTVLALATFAIVRTIPFTDGALSAVQEVFGK